MAEEGHRLLCRDGKLTAIVGTPLRWALLAAVAGWAAAIAPIYRPLAQSSAALVITLSPFLIGLSIYFLAEHFFPTWTTGRRATLSMAIYFLIGALFSATLIAARVDFDLPNELLVFFAVIAWPLFVVALFLGLLHIYV